MIVLKADDDRRISIPGVPEPVRRPVDVDQVSTGFTALRTLRIYRFDQGAQIHGHAEEDEVFLIVLSGSIEIKISDLQREDGGDVSVLTAPGKSSQEACTAYLPPQAAYELTATTAADVAYARATPLSRLPAAIFHAAPRPLAPGLTLLLEQRTHAERLRVRVLQIDAQHGNVSLPLPAETDGAEETLIHLRTLPADGVATIVAAGEPIGIDSWDTIALASSETVFLDVTQGGSALTLIVSAA